MFIYLSYSIQYIPLVILQALWLFVPYADRKDQRTLLITGSLSIVFAVSLSVYSAAVSPYGDRVLWLINHLAAGRYDMGINVNVILHEIGLYVICSVYFYFMTRSVIRSMYEAALLLIGISCMDSMIYMHEAVLFMPDLFNIQVNNPARLILAAVIAGVFIYVFRSQRRYGLGRSGENLGNRTIVLAILSFFIRSLNRNYIFHQDPSIIIAIIAVPLCYWYFIEKGLLKKHLVAEELQQSKIDQLFRNEMKMAQDYSAQMTMIRHNMLHHMNHIRHFLSAGDKEGAEIYAEKVMLEYGSESRNYSSNVYVNAILNYYAQNHPETVIEPEIMIGDDCGIHPMDIGLIVFLIVDSAIQQKNKTIKLKAYQIEDTVFIRFTDVNVLLSGADLSVIEDILMRYHGEKEIDSKAGSIVFLLQNFPFTQPI